jgi:hypothetical protein
MTFIDIGVDDLSGSHHRANTRPIQMSLPFAVVGNHSFEPPTTTYVQHRQWMWFPSLEVTDYSLDGHTSLAN